MSMNVQIRDCTHADAAVLTDLGRKTFYDTFRDVNTAENMELYLRANFTTAKLEQELLDPASKFFMALVADDPAGFAKIRTSKHADAPPDGKAVEIERMYALQSFLGKGVGNRLMEHCLSFAEANGFEVVWLGVWEFNPRAIRFYEKFGFEQYSQHLFMLGNDEQTDLLMKKTLKPKSGVANHQPT